MQAESIKTPDFSLWGIQLSRSISSEIRMNIVFMQTMMGMKTLFNIRSNMDKPVLRFIAAQIQ
ncbi:hypothetical Protein YC6258_03594 [Gynuella sunshinyii YC6258]|uniref:Uncharacterized protein n=1 Tax=Gynuella sunshinyii YC6258 TaxID=1445510 RepID=A0A0C5V8B3_9GAMM|nr:hypothetical Protein YC6258_03594 [Gynuella sunshinyii YC6258]